MIETYVHVPYLPSCDKYFTKVLLYTLCNIHEMDIHKKKNIYFIMHTN